MNHDAFFAAVRSSLFDGSLSQAAVDGINAILPAFQQWGDGDVRKLAYIFATAHHETGRFRWLREIWGPTAAQKRYEGRADLGNTQPGDGRRFMGRGFVHITGRHNYTDWSKRLGIDLVGSPELAERPEVAAQIIVEGMILGTFTAHALSRYITAPSADYAGARRVVNHTDRAALIAGYARQYEAALRAAGWSEATIIDPIITLPEETPMPVPVGHNGGPPMNDGLSPIDQMNKPVQGAKGNLAAGGVGAALLVLASTAGWLPAAWTTSPDAMLALGIVVPWLGGLVGNFVGSYRAPDKRFQA